MTQRTFSGHVLGGSLQFEESLEVFEGQDVSVTVTAPSPLPQRSTASPEPDGAPIKTAQDLLNSQIVGIWSDRTDIVDGPSFARQLREQAEQRGGSVNAPRQ